MLTLGDVKLYDLLQFGSNGCCCYHQLYVGPEPAPLRYCLLTDSQEMGGSRGDVFRRLGQDYWILLVGN